MIKLFVSTLMCFIFFSFFSLSQATPITSYSSPAELESAYNAGDYSGAVDQLTANLLGVNYITGFGYDWAWVSPVNVEDYSGIEGTNTLYAPELQENWVFANDSLLNILKTNFTKEDFKTLNGDIIQATAYFNSDFDYVNFGDFSTVSSQFFVPSADPFAFLTNSIFSQYETFYVRASNLRPSLVVPEPSTLIIFTLGLIALGRKKSLFR